MLTTKHNTKHCSTTKDTKQTLFELSLSNVSYLYKPYHKAKTTHSNKNTKYPKKSFKKTDANNTHQSQLVNNRIKRFGGNNHFIAYTQ